VREPPSSAEPSISQPSVRGSWAPWVVAVFAGIAFVASVPLSYAAGVNDADDLMFIVPLVPAVGLYLWIGATIASRARNAIGWIFISVVAFFALGSLAGYYATLALVERDGTLPFGEIAAWVDRWAIVGSLAPFVLLFLLFPTGDTPSRRWRWLLWTELALIALDAVLLALTPGRLTGVEGQLKTIVVENPIGVAALEDVADPVTLAIGFALLVSGFASVAALVVRYRRAGREERQQIRWLAYVGAATAASIVALFATGIAAENDPGGLLEFASSVAFFVTFVLLVLGVPVASAIAILRYRLYDLDLVVRKSLVFAGLGAFITIVYVAIVGGIGAIVGSRADATLSFVAAAVLALLFHPARERARRIADRLVYGRRATPYEVLAEFSDRMGEALAAEDVLPRMAAIVGRAVGAVGAAIRLDVGGRVRDVATWSADEAGTAAPAEHSFEVRHQGEILGAVTVAMPPDDPMDPSKEKLVHELASQAGLVLRNARLIEELRASRQRLVAAQDEERRKIERNLHDGAQQHLVALAVQLTLAEQMVGRDAAKEREIIHRVRNAANDALEQLRDLARGIYPPLLADKGLAAALDAHAKRLSIPVSVDVDGVGRYPQEIEFALYFCALEALNNVSKYAHASHVDIRLRQGDHGIVLEIADDGIGFDPGSVAEGTGIRGMSDRLEAVGGRIEIRTAPGEGTTVTAVANVASTGEGP
jgi:signal transduction histidine kinase